MRVKKIRGHKRIWKEIAIWKQAHMDVDLHGFDARERNYVKVNVSPFCDYSLLNSSIPEPKGKTRRLILEGLLDIYDAWKFKLDQAGRPYYLKLWLYEPHFSRSQVVCATGDALNFYEQTFYLPPKENAPATLPGGELSGRLNEFQWDHAFDEDQVSNRDTGLPEDFYSYEEYGRHKKHITARLKKAHRKELMPGPDGRPAEYFFVKNGSVWLGHK